MRGMGLGTGARCALAGGVSLLLLGGATGVTASPSPRSPDLGRRTLYQELPPDGDWDGEASVSVEIGPQINAVTTVIVVPPGATTAPPETGQPSSENGAAPLDETLVGAISADGGAGAAGEAGTAASGPADLTTGGRSGVTVEIGDTIGGQGEPGAEGGDAIVDVAIGPLADGATIPGEAENAGQGAARGGSAIAGEASVEIRIGDTIGGDAVAGVGGQDAVVAVEIGPITGGLAIGGDAIGGAGAHGGDARGGTARGGDAAVSIVVGSVVGLDGAGGGEPAGISLDVESVTGGGARGGNATGGSAPAVDGLTTVGGDAGGGDAEGGAALIDLRIVELRGGSYRGSTGPIVGGDATGGDATGGDAVSVETHR